MEHEEHKQKLLIREKTSSLEELSLVEKVWNESKLMWIVAAPAIFTRFSIFAIYIISQAFVGRIGSMELAAFAVVFTVLIRFANGILFGIAGAMTSTILGFWIPNIGQLIFVTCGWCSETWHGFSFLAFKDLWPVVKLSISSGTMLCLEFWYYTILVLLTGGMKNAEVEINALSICLNINGWEIMIAFGFMAASSVRVANELGKGSAKAAKFSVVVTVLTSFTIGFLLFLFFLFFRERLAYIFISNNKDVVNAVGDLSPLLSISILLNSVQPVLSGVAVGAGWQNVVAYVNIGCYYVIGIPVGIVLGHVINLQVKGIWIGMLFGTLIQTIVLTIITYKTNWEEQVIIARNRINRWSKLDDDHETSTTILHD
ncbi:hypothetical protein RIF29_05313 [Crotalaria pallida]|uniref:Uncharacterized protein n=1 Tax=Crotalaria pallida TaxID=3830 RepID=A0AAN9J241_CROPI